MPLFLTFIDLKKAFHTVETDAVMEALGNQGVPIPYIKILRELYSNFTTNVSPFYNVIIDVNRECHDAMRGLEHGRLQHDMEVNIDGRHLHHLRFADDIVLITTSINQAERMLAEFDETCREINMMNDLTSELGRRARAAWEAFKSIEDVVKRTKNIRLRAHLFSTTVLPALTYAPTLQKRGRFASNRTIERGR
ncbi:hypothetical protein RB195_024851 [Necator americanus]|uniref:Reverse transcriptase domain-containing protein n=1 Tax=Necator americanus TaxID=51031 RepID=A0ABR1EPX3_NECAM